MSLFSPQFSLFGLYTTYKKSPKKSAPTENHISSLTFPGSSNLFEAEKKKKKSVVTLRSLTCH